MVPRWSIILAACASMAAVVPGAAVAGTAVRLETAGELPFTADELEQAVGARVTMSAEAGAALVTVGPVADAGVQLRMGGRQTVVAVGGHAGLAAARMVALAIAELAAAAPDGDADEGEAEAEEHDAPRAPPEVVAPAGPPSIAAPATPLAGGAPSTRMSLAFGTLKGPYSEEPFIWTGEADVAVPRNGFDLIGGVGVWDVPTIHAGRPDELSLLAGVVRVGVGWRPGPVQVVVAPFIAPYRVEGPAIHHTSVLVGAGAMARFGIDVSSNVEVFGALRVDAFANQVRIVSPSEDPTFATPRVAAAAALGVAWGLGI